MKLSTRCVHAGTIRDELSGGVNTPIHVSSAHVFPNPHRDDAGYPRYNNIPSQIAVAEKIASLEGADDAIVTASGLGAIAVTLFSMLGSGDHAVIQADVYGGTFHLVETEFARLGIEYTFVPGTEPENLKTAILDNTKLIYIETPSNPLLQVTDIEAVAEIAQAHGLVSVIDNTFATPLLQRPLEWGFDLVVHSGTKYLNGHSDLNCGAVAGRADYMERIRECASIYGPTLNVMDCFLLERGLKTLELRMQRHSENGMMLAQFLRGHSSVDKVYYPGLEDHPNHDIAARQMDDFSGMMSFTLKDGTAAHADAFLASLKLVVPAISLGGVESLACIPAQTSHWEMPREEREKLGITDSLIRISVGIEDPVDIVEDVRQALEACQSST